MNILMVVMGLDIGGAETHVVEVCKGLIEAGHHVTVASNGGVYVDEIVSAGVRHVRLPLNNKRVDSVLKSYFGLKRLIEDNEFDIVHAHARIPAFICSMLERNISFRFVTTAHLDFSLNPVWQRVACWGEKTLAVSEDIKEYLIKGYGVCPDNISVTINGIDDRKFSGDVDAKPILREFGLDARNKRIVYVSRIDPDRSLPAFHLVSVAPELVRKFGKLDIIIVGGGDDLHTLKKMADSANAEIGYPAVIIAGTRTDINRFIACADVFVGVSRSALEAMSAGKPVVLSGGQGYLGIVSHDDPEKLKIAMDTNFCCRGCAVPDEKTLLSDISHLLDLMTRDPAEFTRYGEFNKSIIKTHYSVSRMVDDYVQVYQSLAPYGRCRHGDIIISGYYGFSNMGDDSLLTVMIEALKEAAPELKITALTRKPRKMRLRYGVRCISRTNIIKIYSEMKNAKLMISGGGSLLQDGTSTKSLYYYIAVINAAHRMKLPIMLYANGIGPLYGENNRKYSAEVIRKTSMVTLREPASLTELENLGVDIDPERIKISADPAFLLTPVDNERISYLKNKAGFVPGRKYFAVSLREGHNFGKITEKIDSVNDNLVSEVAKACFELRKTHDIYPVFIPMQPQMDTEICMRVFDSDLVEGGIMLEELTAKELSGILAGVEFVLGMRLHILIYASQLGIPVIGLSYDPKIDALMNYIEQPYIIDVTKVKSEDVTEFAREIESNRDLIVDKLKTSAARMRRLAAEDAKRAVDLARNIL